MQKRLTQEKKIKGGILIETWVKKLLKKSIN
jgi:hypothetical protein